MELPKTIYAGQDEFDGYAYWFHVPQEPHHNCPKYIRADLVAKLKGYAVHKYDCRADEAPEGVNPCTCGLTEVLKEMGE